MDRFPEVAELRDVFSLEIRGRINTLALSRNTQYVAYLVFKLIDAQGLENHPVELSVGVKGGHHITNIGCLEPYVRGIRYNNIKVLRRASVRNDGWLEIQMGEFFTSDRKDEEVQMSVIEKHGAYLKRGFFVEGIEVRTKKTI